MIDGRVEPITRVRERWESTAVLDGLASAARGWAAVTLGVIERLNQVEFSLQDIYRKEAELSRLFPNNRHIRAKLRQQLQVIRDLGLIRFLGNGRYALKTCAGLSSHSPASCRWEQS